MSTNENVPIVEGGASAEGCIRAAVMQADAEDRLLEFLSKLASFGLIAGAAPVLPRITTTG